MIGERCQLFSSVTRSELLSVVFINWCVSWSNFAKLRRSSEGEQCVSSVALNRQ